MTDNEAINSVLKGNKLAFRFIADKYQTIVFRTCMGFVHNQEDAEDLTQNIFVDIYKSLASFNGKSAFSTWVYRIAINASLNFVRNKTKRSFFSRMESLFSLGFHQEKQFSAVDNQNPEQILTKKELNATISDALNSLTENQRIAFTLSKYDDMSQREIAQIMNLTEGAVEALLQRAKTNLQKKLTASYKNLEN